MILTALTLYALIAPPPSCLPDELDVQVSNEQRFTIRELPVFDWNEIAGPLVPLQSFHMHEVKVVDVVTERNVLKSGIESKQLDTEIPEIIQDVYSCREFDKIEEEVRNFLIHSLKEEFEEVKERDVLSVRPEQRMP